MTENYLNILAQTIRNNWDQPALTDFYLTEDGKAQDTSRGNHYTYGEMYAEIVRVADLLTNLGLQKGDHIAICGANSAHWVIAYLAIAKMQGVSVTVMHSLQPDEIARLVDFSDAKALFVEKELWEGLKEQSLLQVQSVIALEEWSILRGEQIDINYQLTITNDQCQFVHGEPDELAMICFTSGTSGNSKGVMLSYLSLFSNITNTVLLSEKVSFNDNCFLSVLPYSHMFGLIDNLLSHLTIGKHVHICPLSIANSSCQVLQFVQPYGIAITPFILKKMHEDNRGISLLKKLKYIELGGAPISVNDEKKYLHDNIPYYNGYGLTETGPHIATNHYNNIKISSCGKIVSGMTCRISPDGEILVKGENVMLGYYKDPEATAQKIDKDGWLHTGDKGHLDEDGYLYVEGRLEQDIIVLPNGENIRPDNIESLINALPEVKESIVLARDGKLVAIVIRDQSSVVSEADFRRKILRQINPQLPLFSQLYDVEITDVPLQRTEKMTIKRYLYS